MFKPALLLVILAACTRVSFVRAQHDTLNYTDADGYKQGYWVMYGKDLPERGYCDTCCVEEGGYVNDRKHGKWILYHKDGVTPRIIGFFEKGRPGGQYDKYDLNGTLVESGTYLLGRQRGVLLQYYSSGCLRQEKYYNEYGKEDSISRMYFDNYDTNIDQRGLILFEKYWLDDTVIKTYQYDSTGKLIDSSRFYGHDYVLPPATSHKENNSAIDRDSVEQRCGTSGIIKDGKKFDPDGYNQIYNRQNELWLDGVFKNGYLVDGKCYRYDSDGILLKIEIWKNGNYHSDAAW